MHLQDSTEETSTSKEKRNWLAWLQVGVGEAIEAPEHQSIRAPEGERVLTPQVQTPYVPHIPVHWHPDADCTCF